MCKIKMAQVRFIGLYAKTMMNVILNFTIQKQVKLLFSKQRKILSKTPRLTMNMSEIFGTKLKILVIMRAKFVYEFALNQKANMIKYTK